MTDVLGAEAAVTVEIAYTLNSRPREAKVEARRLLVHHLRNDCGLTGTHIGCDTSQCGACTVLVDGRAAKSCTLLAVQADGHDIVTVEGVAAGRNPHPVQQAFAAHHGLQCGFCTPGMLLLALDLIAHADDIPSEAEVRHALHGNLCRCTGYEFIVDAILAAAEALMAGAPASQPEDAEGRA